MAAKDRDEAEPAATIAYGPLESRLGYVLRRAQVAVFQDFYRVLGDLAITPAQYATLTVIESNPGSSQTRIADALGIKKANFVVLIKDLESRDLIVRKPTPEDRRSFAVTLSPAGAALLAQAHRASEIHERAIRDRVGAKAYEALFAPLGRIAGLG